ncbi:unnamed protein product [Symbiodinium sp. CCMP2592]|nr:unnamed protein product [Symbiodinium sp. CCMP2592]
MTDLASLEVLSEGALKFLALAWPEGERTAPVSEALAIPVLKSGSSVLLCIPCGFLSLSALDAGQTAEDDALLGPSRQVTLPFGNTDEQGLEVPIDLEQPVLLVDFSSAVLEFLRDLGEDLVAEGVFPYILHQPDATPLGDELLTAARSWVRESPAERIAFYSALEDAEPMPAEPPGPKAPKGKKATAAKKRVTTADLAQQMTQLVSMLPSLTEQITAMKERQETLEKQVAAGPAQPTLPLQPKPAHQQPFLPSRGPGLPLAKQASLVGPPPRTRPPAGEAAPAPLDAAGALDGDTTLDPAREPLQAALLQQSQALTSLVNHLVSQQDGGLSDLASSSSAGYVGSKGAARREKLQGLLANRSGDFFLSVVQAASKRLHPSQPSPTSIAACSGQVSMCQYLERFGGYAGHRETGYVMWCLAHVMDCLIQQDVTGAQEFLALTFVALDQSSLDGGRWDFAWLLTLLEEPPAQLFHGRGVSANPRTRAFSPLSPVGWTTCALQYLKEVDLIVTRLDRPAPPSGALFPLPLPCDGAFARFPLECSSRFRRRVMHRRLLHIVCMALNFLHSNFVPIPLSALQRPHNAAQRSLVAHVGRHLKAFGASVGEFSLSDSGRRNPQLIARLSELLAFLSASSAATGDAYADLSGTAVPMHNELRPGLDPFKSLDVSRLRLSGRGAWDPLPHLPDELYMAYAEPRSLHHGAPPGDEFLPVWTRESPAQTASLASLWDELGLLRLVPASISCSESYRLARAFNCYKTVDKDRMIIDRRGQNAAEARLPGPSLFIPVGPMLGMLEANPGKQSVLCAATDRKDFYHQLQAGENKAVCNALGPALPRAQVQHLKAFRNLLRPPAEWLGGSSFALSGQRPSLLFDPSHFLICFGAVAQGDHLGVEFGTACHSSVLSAGGLLAEHQRLCANRPFKGLSAAEGLVIDDYFSVCVHDLTSRSPPLCLSHLWAAKKIYRDEGLLGSDDKDILAEPFAKIAGAQVNSTAYARSLGLITVSAPSDKRVALAMVTLEAARFGSITDSLLLSLIGSWTSVALFRRPLMAVLSSAYAVAPGATVNASLPRLCLLPRAASQELVLLSVLSLLAAADLSAPFGDWLYATDASERKAADASLLRPLWRTASKKGGYSRLFSKEEAVLARFTDREPYDLRMQAGPSGASLSRPLAYFFDFLEAGVGCGQVSSVLTGLGRSVGPYLAPCNSSAYDLSNLRTFEWLLFLIQHRRLRSLLLLPPTTTFLTSGWPSKRSRDFPKGRLPPSSRTLRANLLASRFLAAFFSALSCGVVCVLGHPGSSYLTCWPEWRRLLCMGATELSLCLGPFLGTCCKDCKFLVFGIDLSSLLVPCRLCASAVKTSLRSGLDFSFPASFAKALATEFDHALRRVSHVDSHLRLSTDGLENPVLNDIVLSLSWEEGSAWTWRSPTHINILETASILRLLRSLAPGGPQRVVVLVDSSVAFNACAKGRSPSFGLMPVLRKIAAVCLASGLTVSFHFVPTRLNPGDCPTRDLDLPAPLASSFWGKLSHDELYEGLAMPKLRRWASNWARLVCLTCGCPPAFRPSLGWRALRSSSRLFDSSLGYPGEGPSFRVFLWGFLFFRVLAVPSHVLRPRNAADEKRSAARSVVLLPEGRPVEPVTQKRRDKLLAAFADWLLEQGFELLDLCDLQPGSTKRLNQMLVCYGRQLFDAGWPYSHYSEVINAVTGKEPGLRRSLQPAWDLAFAWLREEPHSHHVALPWQLLTAACSLALLWGWPRVAGVLALTWGAVMRIGEVFSARRQDLLLPADVRGTICFGLVSIGEPKTRFRGARHQSAKIDQPDLLAIVTLAFGHLGAHCKLWPYSPATMRSRFDQLIAKLGADRWRDQGSRKLDLGSLRAGGGHMAPSDFGGF